MKVIAVLLFLGLLSACANISHYNQQQVFFKEGGLGVTKVITQEGIYDIYDGSGSYLMTRSRHDIPIKIICPNGETKEGLAFTRYDWLVAGLGNWWTYFIGSGIEAFTDRAYVIQDVSLRPYCRLEEHQ